MSLHPFATRDLAEAYLTGLGFTHDPATDVWAAPDGHRLGYVVQSGPRIPSPSRPTEPSS
jgi:hypothetical protein